MNYGKEFKSYATKHAGIPTIKFENYEKRVNENQIISSPQNITPYILEERQMNVIQLDVMSRLMSDRIIFLNDEVNDNTMSIINAQLLFLSSVDSKKDINLYVMSGGGSVIMGCSLCDIMAYIPNDVSTTVMGMAASMGAIISTSGTKGKRNILKHSRIMIHDIRGGSQGTFLDQQRSFDLSKELRDELFTILAENSGNSFEQITEWCDRDMWFKSDKAVELGFADNIIERKS